MIKYQQSQALTSHFESFWSIVESEIRTTYVIFFSFLQIMTIIGIKMMMVIGVTNTMITGMSSIRTAMKAMRLILLMILLKQKVVMKPPLEL